jgi:predicted nucleotidyltransferase
MEKQYPTEMHKKAATEITNYFSKIDDVKAVLVTCSCARGKASKDSCLDMAILLLPELEKNSRTEIIDLWNKELETNEIYKEFGKVGKYTHVDLEFINGDFKEGSNGWTSGPDQFELEIGNFIAYSKPLYKRDTYYDELRSIWLPYYNESQRSRRLGMVKKYCLNNLDHIPIYVDRQLYFQSFNRLYHAIGEFLQALFISKRIYPIAYDKWIKEQLCELLKMQDVYNELVQMMEYKKFESTEHKDKAEKLKMLLSQYCRE